MNIKIIVQDVGTDVVKAIHQSEAFIEHVAGKIAAEFGLKKEAVVAIVTQAMNSAPNVGETIAPAVGGNPAIDSIDGADTGQATS